MAEPLTIWVYAEWSDRPEVQALAEAGHAVFPLTGVGNLPEADLILHPNAWRWTDDLFPHLDVTIKEARKVKYGDERKQKRLEAKARKATGSRKGSKRAARE